MMTIRHVDDGGRESIVSVESATFDKKYNCLVGCGLNGFEFRWTSGHAYVMNEQGKTVAVYNITMPVRG